MLRSTFSTCAVALVGLCISVGSANAGIAWYGFSDLCFTGTFKGGSDKDGTLVVDIKEFDISATCINEQNGSLSCQDGVGNNAGQTLTVVTTASADPEKDKGTIYTPETCFSMDRFDQHADQVTKNQNPDGTWNGFWDYHNDIWVTENPLELNGTPGEDTITGTYAEEHYHVCHASNPNKIEVPHTARITRFVADWTLNQSGKISKGAQTCYWLPAYPEYADLVVQEDSAEPVPAELQYYENGGCYTSSDQGFYCDDVQLKPNQK